jgi:stage V sporulation protein K
MHCIFQGAPGTGKTTMAGLIADVLKRMGVVSGPVSCIHANSVIGKYFGHTEKLVDEAVAAAKGGVLFIDEAYCWSKYHAKSFGPSAISQVMDHIDRRSCVFIFAGYTAG